MQRTKKEPEDRRRLENELAELYYMAGKLVQALPPMAQVATNEELRAGIEMHVEDTKEQFMRLEEIFHELGKAPRTKRCAALDRVLRDVGSAMGTDDDHLRDAALMATAQDGRM